MIISHRLSHVFYCGSTKTIFSPMDGWMEINDGFNFSIAITENFGVPEGLGEWCWML